MTESTFTIIANPILHDKSDNQYSTTGKPSANEEDRTVSYANGTETTQKQMIATGLTWQDTQKYINYLPPTLGKPVPVPLGQPSQPNIIRLPNKDYTVGTVDMQQYLNWLNDPDNGGGYNINMTVQ